MLVLGDLHGVQGVVGSNPVAPTNKFMFLLFIFNIIT
jgi:hypothetical protein